VLEGASFAIRHVIELLETDDGVDIQELRIGGAAAASGVWNQIIADILGKKVVSLTQSHTEVLGAAVLAGVSQGVYPDLPSAIKKLWFREKNLNRTPRRMLLTTVCFPYTKHSTRKCSIILRNWPGWIFPRFG
jgi:sugar (pentulose or hexulose) kinase